MDPYEKRRKDLGRTQREVWQGRKEELQESRTPAASQQKGFPSGGSRKCQMMAEGGGC